MNSHILTSTRGRTYLGNELFTGMLKWRVQGGYRFATLPLYSIHTLLSRVVFEKSVADASNVERFSVSIRLWA